MHPGHSLLMNTRHMTKNMHSYVFVVNLEKLNVLEGRDPVRFPYREFTTLQTRNPTAPKVCQVMLYRYSSVCGRRTYAMLGSRPKLPDFFWPLLYHMQ